MPIFSDTHTCLAIDNEDLVVSFVRTSPTGVTTSRGPRVVSYLSAGETDRAALTRVDRSDKITLVIPGAWCASRPMPLSAQKWERSRNEVAASIDSLFPLSSDDALLEYIQLAPSQDDAPGVTDAGILIAVSRAHLAPWLERIERDLGRAPDRIVSSHAAIIGTGLQHHDRATIIEPDAVGAPMAHALSRGLPRAIDAPAPASAQGGAALFSLPGASNSDAAPIPAHELAAGAPIAEFISPGLVSPFHGRRTSRLKRMALPAAIALAALVVLATAQLTSRARFQSGLDALKTEQESLAPLVDLVQQQQAFTERLLSNTRRVRTLTADSGEPMLSLLAAGHAVLPADGYLYHARFTPSAVELRGQCGAVGDLFREIESSDTFTAAKRLTPSAPVVGGATFDIAATVSNASATGVSP